MVSVAVISLVLGFGLAQVYDSKAAALEDTAQRLSRHEILLLRRGATPAEIGPYLRQYDDERQRRFIAGAISRMVRDEAPGNVGAIAARYITRADAVSGRVAEQYADRFGRAGGDRVRLFGFDEFARLKPAFAVRTPDEFRSAFRRWVVLFFAVFVFTHIVWSAIGYRGDPYILPAALLLSGTGLILMVSLRDPVRDLLVSAEFAFTVVAACVTLATITIASHFMELRSRGLLERGAFFDWMNDAARKLAKRGNLAFMANLALSVALLAFGSGPGESGAKVRLGFFQPVEVVRLLLVLFLASYFATRWEFLRELKERRIRISVNLPRIDHALPVMIAVAIAIAFFFLQKDLGPAVILAGLFLCLYAVARRRAGLAIAAAALLIGVGWLAYHIGYPPIAVTRIGMWLSPWNNGLAHGEQLVHGLWAMATGGVAGTGIGAGQPELIPAAHTDLILAAVGEELGLGGFLAIAGAFAVLIWRGIRIALRAATDYDFFLALGLTLALALGGALIAGGVLGILPLAGVVMPFLSYGGTAMIVNFACLGVLLAVSAKPGRPAPNPQFTKPVAALAVLLATFGTVVSGKALWVQALKADEVVAAGALVLREDGSYARAYNPRLLAIARQIERGTIYDRNGLPLATARWDELEKNRVAYAALGIDIDRACARSDSRHYPFGPAMFHLLGDLRTRLRWAAPNAAFEERVSRTRLQGFNDREVLDRVELPRTGKQVTVLRYDYSELVPLLRARLDPKSEIVRKLLDAPRDVRLAIDARLQMRLTHAFQIHLRSNGWRSGGVVVLRPVSGEVLAAVSLPLPGPDSETALDLARFGEFPPGSAFKIVTAIAALRRDPTLAAKKYECVRLADDRVGNKVRGRTIRDDILDVQPHGSIDLKQALMHSCNAFFSQLGTYDVGANDLLAAARLFNIETARPNTPEKLNADLPQAAYGQAQVIVTPLRLARVSGAIAAAGQLFPSRVRLTPADAETSAMTILAPDLANSLQSAMRSVVTSGTGREASKSPVPIAGKTGTAELANAPAHAWFTGYAPAGGPVENRIAFAILVNNGRYGGRAAAPFAVQIVDAARELMQTKPRVSMEEMQ